MRSKRRTSEPLVSPAWPGVLLPEIHEQRIVLVGLALRAEVGFGLGRLFVRIVRDLGRRLDRGLGVAPALVGFHPRRGAIAQFVDRFERIGELLIALVLGRFRFVECCLCNVALAGELLDPAPAAFENRERLTLRLIETADHLIAHDRVETGACERAEALGHLMAKPVGIRHA